ncbi:hypothetical protein NOF04DRAFT_1363172 [Fusarium oxysporum II5]|nr:hypothetical protein NOF04DRAFT_1363172 [Fusarium oxysporum II5]
MCCGGSPKVSVDPPARQYVQVAKSAPGVSGAELKEWDNYMNPSKKNRYWGQVYTQSMKDDGWRLKKTGTKRASFVPKSRAHFWGPNYWPEMRIRRYGRRPIVMSFCGKGSPFYWTNNIMTLATSFGLEQTIIRDKNPNARVTICLEILIPAIILPPMPKHTDLAYITHLTKTIMETPCSPLDDVDECSQHYIITISYYEYSFLMQCPYHVMSPMTDLDQYREACSVYDSRYLKTTSPTWISVSKEILTLIRKELQ